MLVVGTWLTPLVLGASLVGLVVGAKASALKVVVGPPLGILVVAFWVSWVLLLLLPPLAVTPLIVTSPLVVAVPVACVDGGRSQLAVAVGVWLSALARLECVERALSALAVARAVHRAFPTKLNCCSSCACPWAGIPNCDHPTSLSGTTSFAYGTKTDSHCCSCRYCGRTKLHRHRYSSPLLRELDRHWQLLREHQRRRGPSPTSWYH